MKTKLTIPAILTLALAAVSCGQGKPETETEFEPADYVSTLVGTQSDYSLSTGNTYPAIALPWGMNFWTPQTGHNGNGWAYTYNAHKIRGFKQTHQPSPWINDYGQFSLMPLRDFSQFKEEERASFFSHQSETARPFYYSVYLADHDVKVEITPTERAAVFRFTFPESSTSAVVIDAFDKGSSISVDPASGRVSGCSTRNSGGVGDNFCNYFTVAFDKPVESFTIYDGDKQVDGNSLDGEHAIAVVRFNTGKGEVITARASSSFISHSQAQYNLKEVEDKDFDTVCKEAKARWNEILGRIRVSGGTTDQLRTFYSCLYRSVLFPRSLYEYSPDGKILHYSPYDGQVHEGYLYGDTGFWDTFRSLFPLLNLVYPDVNRQIQLGMVNIAKENELLPEWSSPGHRNCMVGNNSASVVADAIVKGVSETDLDTLYRAILYGTEHVHPKARSSGRLGHEWYNTMGYIPCDIGINESVARTLEYAYDDWCILQIAKRLGRPGEELAEFSQKAMNYKRVFDKETSLMRGRLEDGSFETPFSPYKWGGVFTEGNSWHYTWSVFHDVQGLINLMGGEENFCGMLDSVFVVPPIYDDSYYGARIHEITEMQVADMGNYAHGNQPAQHMIYLYGYAGQPWKTQKWVREVMDRLYRATPDGYCGDEDNGQTSAWYIFSSLGFYPVCPASDQYVLGAPLFKKAEITRPDGTRISIDAPGNSPDKRYVSSLQVNGRNWEHNYLLHSDLVKGASLKFDMSEQPDTTRGTAEADKPYSFTNEFTK